WIAEPRARLERLYLSALAEAGVLHAGAGDAKSGAACFRLVVEREPANQEASRGLMRALAALRDRQGIEREYRRLRQTLAGGTGAAPLPETRRAHEQALNATPVAGAAGSSPGRAAGRAHRRRPQATGT